MNIKIKIALTNDEYTEEAREIQVQIGLPQEKSLLQKFGLDN